MRETEVGEDGYATGRLEVADVTHVADEGEVERSSEYGKQKRGSV